MKFDHARENTGPKGPAAHSSGCGVVCVFKTAHKTDSGALRFKFVAASVFRGNAAGAVSVGPVSIAMGTCFITCTLSPDVISVATKHPVQRVPGESGRSL